MRLDYHVFRLTTRHPFRIARGRHAGHHAVWVTLTDADGLTGTGEANPTYYYGETPETVVAALEVYRPALESVTSPFAVQEIEIACLTDLRGNGSARAGIIAALYDLMGKRVGLPVHTLLGLDPSRTPRTSFTIGIDEVEIVRRKVREAAEFPILKVKVGTDSDEQRLAVIREERPDALIRVDANTAWSSRQAMSRIERLERFGLELVEQPVAAHDLEGMRFVRERSPVPVVADESCVTSHDVARLAGVADGINIKLAKCGGIAEALRMIHIARAHDLSIMLGCMVESSLGIAAAAQLAPLADWADLDGAALLDDDPFSGLSIAGGRIHLTDAPGLGVTRR